MTLLGTCQEELRRNLDLGNKQAVKPKMPSIYCPQVLKREEEGEGGGGGGEIK